LSQVVRTKGPVAVPEREDAPRVSDVPTYVAGEIIADKYRLIRRLGEGGMGSVWVARNLALDVHVALKLIRTDVDTEGADERLLTEARATARLKHPNIVRVFDFGRTRRGDPFIVMELLQGETLGDVLDREGRLSATYTVQLLLPCADALAAAHSKGIVHRDLKPDNVYLADSDGCLQPKVVDFGIAKFELEQRDHKLTQAGTVLGSPDYMSPEQARGVEDIDHRADIWAFCVVLYECITGRVPFEEANYNALLRHIIEDEIPSTLNYAAGDPELWRILQKGFSKDRAKRYQGMREIGEDLAAWLTMHGITEDVSGHSLRAAWLDPSISRPDGYLRQTYPPGSNPPGRPSLSSYPTTLPPHARVGPPPIQVEVPRRASAKPPAPKKRGALLGVVGFLLLALLGAGVTWFVLHSQWEATPAASEPTPTAPVRAEEPTPTAPNPVLSASPPSSPVDESPAQSSTEKTPSSPSSAGKMGTAPRSRPAQRPNPPPVASEAPKKKSPYEDLGF
jgi:serine/threonine-protein kinase